MKKVKLLLQLGMLSCLTLLLSSFSSKDAATRVSTYSSCYLINPPNPSIQWVFNGDQVILVTVSNGNVLGVTVSLRCDIFADENTRSWVLLPLQVLDPIRYDIFGPLPIGWKFTISTASSVASIGCEAYWEHFV